MHTRGKTAATDVCHQLRQRLSDFLSSSSSLYCFISGTKIASYPVNVMGLQVTKTAAVGGRENSRLCWSFLSGGAGLVCSSPVLRWVFPCETASASTAPFQLPQLLHVSLSLPLSVLKQTKDGGGWVDGRGVSWNTEGSLSGIFSYGFLQACILKTLCYNIFSYSTQLRSWEGTVGPTLFSSAHFLFFFFF